ncbi:hypothetical protein [Haloimpatiens massiliensis]|uniref:hypothetical protein n=1 Tax=Haloimpatiens massiliensis TaxID=1658110 RepID=UPI000C82711D|nr:hypothetical protein [Haloimpatiens massiliensis]
MYRNTKYKEDYYESISILERVIMRYETFTVEQREKLYNEVWEEPLVNIAKRYEISEATLRKRCNKLDIPLPPKGYWQKIKSGKEIKKPALSKIFGKYVQTVRKSIIKYKYNANELNDERLLILKDEELSLLTDETKILIKKKCDNIVVKNQLRNPHQLILDHQEEMMVRKQKEKELRESRFFINRYSSEEVLYKNFKSSLPIHVSANNIKRVYCFLNTLFKALEELDASILVQGYLGKDVADIRVGRHFYEFKVKEENKKSKKKKKDEKENSEETGTIIFIFSVKSSYGQELNKSFEYRDLEIDPLETQLSKIIFDLFAISNKLDILEELADREFNRRWEEEKRERCLEEMKKAELVKIAGLEDMIADWDKARKMREFADRLEKNITGSIDSNEKTEIVSWIKWIRDKADWFDPLVSREDELLGKKNDFHNILKHTELVEKEFE